jgi:hypothetical protein
VVTRAAWESFKVYLDKIRQARRTYAHGKSQPVP